MKTSNSSAGSAVLSTLTLLVEKLVKKTPASILEREFHDSINKGRQQFGEAYDVEFKRWSEFIGQFFEWKKKLKGTPFKVVFQDERLENGSIQTIIRAVPV